MPCADPTSTEAQKHYGEAARLLRWIFTRNGQSVPDGVIEGCAAYGELSEAARQCARILCDLGKAGALDEYSDIRSAMHRRIRTWRDDHQRMDREDCEHG